jgi:hypothetical protein
LGLTQPKRFISDCLITGVKKSVAERKLQITRKLTSSKVPASKQKRELSKEIIEIKKQINPEVKKFHEQQTAAMEQVCIKDIFVISTM